jgi:acetolactate synthase I/II/III large subunit
MQVADVIIEILKREGHSKLFCYPTTPIIEAAAKAGMRPYLCRQERVGVDMADGFARVTNGPAVFAMQYGPGAENAYAGVATAFSDAAPILLLPLSHARATSQVFPMFRGVKGYAGIVKSLEEIILPGEVENVMRRAFSALSNGRRGPVMVETPLDVVNMELGDFPMSYRPVCIPTSRASAHDVEEAARLLVEARRPIILGGQGVLYARATPELVELAELLRIPVTTSVDGKSGFPEDHPLSLGTAGAVMGNHTRWYLDEADLVFGVGTSFTRHPLVAPVLPDDKRIIHAHDDPTDFNKAYRTEVGLLGDVRLTLRDLIEAVRQRLGARQVEDKVSRDIAHRRDGWMAEWMPKLTSDQIPMTPYRVMGEFIRTVNPAEAIVTHDSGSPRDQLLPFYKATTPRSYLGWGKSHALGTGLGLIIGAKIAAPDKFCVNFMGDAAFGMTGLDFETAVRCDAPICTVVLNNSTMAIEIPSLKESHTLYGVRDIGGNYANIARDLGGWSEKVTEPGQIAGAFERARRKTEEGHACLLEFATNAETAFSNRKGMAH